MSSMGQKSEKEERKEFCKEEKEELKLQQKLDKSEELQMEKTEIAEKDIREIRCLQEHHMTQLKGHQKETDELKEKEKHCKTNFNELEKELELLKESYPDKSEELQMDKKEITEKQNSCRRNCNESCDNNMCPECKGSNSFINLNPDVSPYSACDLDSKKTNEQREMRAVTPDTEADRARFGRKHVEWN